MVQPAGKKRIGTLPARRPSANGYFGRVAPAQANSRSGLEAGLTGIEAANGITMKFGVHGAEGIRGRFVVGLPLSAVPFHKQTVADSAKQAHQAHGLGPAHPARVVPVGDAQALVPAQ